MGEEESKSEWGKIKKHLKENIILFANDVFKGEAEEKKQEFFDNVYISGGAIPSLMVGETPHDYDMWLRDEKALKSFEEIFYKKYEKRQKMISKNAFNVFASVGGFLEVAHFQLVRKAGDPDYISSFFDFEHTRGRYDFKSNSIITTMERILLISQRKLIFNKKTLFPLSSLLRMIKFKKRGWNFELSTLEEVLKEVEKLEIKTSKEFLSQVKGFYDWTDNLLIMNRLIASMVQDDYDEKDFKEDYKTFFESVAEGLRGIRF